MARNKSRLKIQRTRAYSLSNALRHDYIVRVRERDITWMEKCAEVSQIYLNYNTMNEFIGAQ
jgi:hypothetical protein